MKLGIPIWQNRISPVMDSARRFLVCEIQDGVVTERSEGAIEGGHPWRLVRFLLDQGIQEILCGAISRPLSSMLTGQGITLYPWVSGEVEAVLEAYLAGELPNERFSLPGCRGGRMRGRHHDFPADWESPGSSWRQEPGAGRRFPRGRGGGYGKGKGRGGGGRGRGGGGGGGRGGGRGRGGGGGGRGGGRGRGGGGGGGRGGGRGRGDERGMKNRIQQKEKEKEDA